MTGPAANSAGVVVCGAGAAGLATALSAARCGASVHLIEARNQVGGTVAGSLIHTLAGLYDDAGQLINDGLPSELVQRLNDAHQTTQSRRMGRVWVHSVCPNIYREAVQDWLESEQRITVHCDAAVTGVQCDGGRVVQVDVSNGRGKTTLRSHHVVDTTGTAEVVRLIDLDLLADDRHRSAGGWIFRVRDVPPGTLDFPHGLRFVRLLREAVETGELPRECAHAWLDLGIHADEVFVKLFVPLADDWRERQKEICQTARQSQAAIMAFLKPHPEFASARVTQVGELGVRDGGRIRGRYWLTEADVREGRRFEDAACRACWPIEYWDPEKGVSIDYLPPGSHYEIPLRCFRLEQWENVWMAGKCLSADRFAQASARVAGTCWAMGEAVGRAVAES